MKLTLEGLAGQLAERLLPAYLVSGDEPLLVDEALDAIRTRARSLGFAEREVFFIERGNAAWDALLQASQALSLFAARRIMEIRLPSGKPGVSGTSTLLRVLQTAGEDLLLLIVTGRLDRETQAAEWVRAVSTRGAWLPVWPVDRTRLPHWLRLRLEAAGLSASAEALGLLAERSEGNLLAARQEIDKLALLAPHGTRVELTDVIASSADSARFDVFQLGEALRTQQTGRALRILASLRAEGTEPTLVLWALLRELRAARSEPPQARPVPLHRLVARAAQVDRMIKGMTAGDPWDELAWLVLETSGFSSVPPLPAVGE